MRYEESYWFPTCIRCFAMQTGAPTQIWIVADSFQCDELEDVFLCVMQWTTCLVRFAMKTMQAWMTMALFAMVVTNAFTVND